MAAPVADVSTKFLEDEDSHEVVTPRTRSLSSNNPFNPNRSPDDPFINANHHSQRFAQFDSQRFAITPSKSPSQAKGVLEAHLTETERRIADASKLGTTLVQQRKDLTQRLKELEKHQGDGEIGPELQQKLLDIEREFNEVGRESARATLIPRSRVASAEGGENANERQTSTPSTLTSQATHSPSKVNVPSRKSRNQSGHRVHDIEFAAEIGTSLLSQVRNLQAIVADKDDALKSAVAGRSKLEDETEGLKQRIRTLNDSEQRYKDENWNLETQTHDLLAAAKQGTEREQKLNQTLRVVTGEKSTAQRELDELKQVNAKIVEEHSTLQKHSDMELSGLRRNLIAAESAKATMQQKIEELHSQNSELAQAIATRPRYEEPLPMNESDDENDKSLADITTPEGSPPPSPSKGTPRHSMLESETLKSSLHHAHRMIQNLKGIMHREKTEKVELKRMLQEARDELDIRRTEGGGVGGNNGGKRRKPGADKDQFKKPGKPNLLGAGRDSKSEILEDVAWEDQAGEASPSRQATAQAVANAARGDQSIESATEASDAFETANEREDGTTETDAFQTGAESLAGDSSDGDTETEGGFTRGGTVRARQNQHPSLLKPGNRASYMSTASTSADEDDAQNGRVAGQPQQRYRLKLNKGYRRSKTSETGATDSNPNSAKNSPASFMSNNSQTAPTGPSLFAELGDLEAEDSGDGVGDTPSRKSTLSRLSTPGSRSGTARRSPGPPPTIPLPNRTAMVDTGTMTETIPEASHHSSPGILRLAAGAVGGVFGSKAASASEGREPQTSNEGERATETTPPQAVDRGSVQTVLDGSQAVPDKDTSMQSSYVSSGLEDKRTDDKPSLPALGVSAITSLGMEPLPHDPVTSHETHLDFSTIRSQATEPVAAAPVIPPRDARRSENVSAMAGLPSAVGPSDEKSESGAHKQGLFGSIFGSRKSATSSPKPKAMEEAGHSRSTDHDSTAVNDTKSPFRDLSNNIVRRQSAEKAHNAATVAVKPSPTVGKSDQSSQTLLSAGEIDSMLQSDHRKTASNSSLPGLTIPASPPKGQASQSASKPTVSTQDSTRARARGPEQNPVLYEPPSMKSAKRPGSSGSIRSSISTHPPLPPDHKQAIAAAAQRVSSVEPVTGSMGPPIAPASAYRSSQSQIRPRTPSGQVQYSQYGQSPASLSKAGTTPRPRHSTARSELSIPVTRRSSVSSFASELDERFNIRVDGMPMPQGFGGPGTDPRMIQAITQTMIGEYLWKYTRKAGRGEMSTNRHRRFFWVHPYTRTLYWSDRDPATAGRAELKAKSVAIEAVRVETDDNPMPPGLHRKSLVIITPGRSVKITATTGQRHETWFNALSYLLLRTGVDGAESGHDEITSADVDEFNPAYASMSARNNAPSLSSYHSRTTRNTSPPRTAVSRHSTRSHTGPTPRQHASASSRTSHVPTGQPGSTSRLSQIFHPASMLRGSFSSRKSRHSARGDVSIYEASEVHDSAEDLRQVIERQEQEADQLENVRACCDGKHDVGSLPKRPQYGPNMNRHSHSLSHPTHHVLDQAPQPPAQQAS
ncbi:MAG: hypothetical protein M1833_006791 [Piccolia ochrophora]|nr:MAG: hypothetical protein M1833_006791 [Piccolia ochrophora]